MPLIAFLDNEPVLRHALAGMFSDKGYDVIEDDDKAAFLSRLSTLKPDLIVSDLNSPGMDGFEFLRELKNRKTTATIPVVILSGFGSNPKVVIESLKLGAIACIAKSTDDDDPVERILAVVPSLSKP